MKNKSSETLKDALKTVKDAFEKDAKPISKKEINKDDLIKEDNPLHDILSSYINKLDSLHNSLPIVMESMNDEYKKIHKEYNKFIDSKFIKVEDDTEEKTSKYIIPLQYAKEFSRQKQKIDSIVIAKDLIPKNFLVSYVSQYDSFLGDLISQIYKLKPELFNESNRTIEFKDLLQFSSIEDAQNSLLEKEIESLLRESHSDQFKVMENKFHVKLTKDLSIWKDFIEITERRNLFVHNDGTISNQYLKICAIHKINITDKRIGDILEVNTEYLNNAYHVFYELGVKLVQVLWRKQFKNQLDLADNSLINITYNLLAHKRYKLAQALLDFACLPIIKCSSDINKKILIINRAIAYKLNNKETECKQILNKDDWSASKIDFQLAVAVLNNDDTEVYSLMRSIGDNNKDLPYHIYLEWPLFEEYREKEEFQIIYKEIFNKDFELIQEV